MTFWFLLCILSSCSIFIAIFTLWIFLYLHNYFDSWNHLSIRERHFSPASSLRDLNLEKRTEPEETLTEISVTRNLSVLVRPERRTVLVEPSRPGHCQENNVTLLIVVFSAPTNFLARSIVRWDQTQTEWSLLTEQSYQSNIDVWSSELLRQPCYAIKNQLKAPKATY